MLSRYSDSNRYYNLFDFEKLVNDMWGTRSNRTSIYDVKVDDNSLVLSVDLPGAKSADLKIEAEGQNLRIAGKQKGVDFKYDYTLAKSFDPTSAIAKFEDGVLNLTFNKYEQAKPKTFNIKLT